ncbi:MAG TPA: hypothetical protein VJP02_32000 [Candidatus Sulfotelmatobacter sp.]|nr:hypothetical protein [Candidatus Sulfotelmatobacter sp.]
MRLAFIAVIVSIALSAASLAFPRGHLMRQSSSCATVEEALRDYQHVKIGATRAEIEKYFARASLSFPLKTGYVYRGCDDIHLDIDFKLSEPRRGMFSPDDLVTDFSKLTLDYPAKD